jgi:soluble lytic murein transglycosylase-like protein
MHEVRILSMDRKTMWRLSLTIIVISLILCPVSARAFCFEEAGRANNISYDLLESIARVESGLNAKALHVNRNGTTDLGLMQINSAWIDPMHLNREELISNPCYNVMAGAGILRQCIDTHGYTWEAVGCYNAKSKGKRVGYSWKIFRELKKEKARKIAIKKESLPENASSGQSLYFRVREAESTVKSEKP